MVSDFIIRRIKSTGEEFKISEMSNEMLAETLAIVNGAGMKSGLDAETCRLRIEIEVLMRARGWTLN